MEAGQAAELAPTAKKKTRFNSPLVTMISFCQICKNSDNITLRVYLHRSGNVLAPSTLQTMERRVLSKHACIFVCAWTSLNIPVYIYIAFLGFVKIQRPDMLVDLTAVLNLSALKEFLKFMKASYISLCTNINVLSTTSVYTAETQPAVVEMATSIQTEAGGTAKKKTRIQLSPGDNPKLFSDMQELRQHYTESISLHRSGNVLAPSTLQTMERVSSVS